jgi:hypothetical protein
MSKGSGIYGMFPENEEEFSKFGEALKNKITYFEVRIKVRSIVRYLCCGFHTLTTYTLFFCVLA